VTLSLVWPALDRRPSVVDQSLHLPAVPHFPGDAGHR